MDKAFSPADIEQRIYERWETSGYFQPSGHGPPYSIVIPPPNVTGTLHMGHAFQDTIMDALIRHRRMLGFDTLWQPGTDHAGIATQMVVERQLNAAGNEPARFRARSLRREGMGVEEHLGRLDRPTDAPIGRIGGLEARQIHHGSRSVRGGHRGLRAPVSGRVDLPGQAAGQLGSGAEDGALGSGSRVRGGIGPSLASQVPAVRRQRAPGRGDDPAGNHARRHRGRRASRR